MLGRSLYDPTKVGSMNKGDQMRGRCYVSRCARQELSKKNERDPQRSTETRPSLSARCQPQYLPEQSLLMPGHLFTTACKYCCGDYQEPPITSAAAPGVGSGTSSCSEGDLNSARRSFFARTCARSLPARCELSQATAALYRRLRDLLSPTTSPLTHQLGR